MTLSPNPGAARAMRMDDGVCPPGKICWDDENGWSTGSGGSGEIILAGIVVTAVVTAGTGWLLHNLFKGAIEISWESFGTIPGGDGDVITVTESAGTEGQLTVNLTIGPDIHWWKAVELYDKNGTLLGSAWCQRDEGVTSNTTSVQASSLEGGYMVFKKAKAFGIHTSMYVIRDLASKSGRVLDFSWPERD